MSRFMQIRLQLEPVYRPELRAHYPKLARALAELGVVVDSRRTTLFHLIREMDRAVLGESRPALRRAMEVHMPQLRLLWKAVEEKLAAWRLEGLDELLYKIEDVFELLEKDLD
jgi:hypothetical protein